MTFESLARTLRKPFYLNHLLVTVDVLVYIFTPICSVPLLLLDGHYAGREPAAVFWWLPLAPVKVGFLARCHYRNDHCNSLHSYLLAHLHRDCQFVHPCREPVYIHVRLRSARA